MASLFDTLSKLKTTIMQTQTARVDASLDKAVKDIIAYKSHSGRNGYIELVRSLISKNSDVKISGVSGSLFGQGVSPISFGQGGRIQRYKVYQSIVTQLNHAYRALAVLIDNILSPDDITKQVLEIRPKVYLEDDTPIQSKVRYVREVVKEVQLERRLDLIVKNTLLFGDLFCEIAGPKTVLTSRSLLNESSTYLKTINDQYEKGTKEIIVNDLGKYGKYEVTMDYSSFLDEDMTISSGGDDSPTDSAAKVLKGKKKKANEKEKDKILSNLKLVFHDPQFVVKLQSSLFPICLGFLVFPVRSALPQIVFQEEPVNNICVAILRSLNAKIPQMKEYKNDQEIKDVIKILLANTDLNKAMEIRYVPPDKMVHFYIPSTKFYPYGESIFDGVQFSAKVLTALETAVAVQRLSRSTEKRKIAIEIGLPRDAKKAIEAMKEEFRKRKISLDSFGSVDTIPSMITTFEDVYIPQKDGKPFVDVSTFDEGRVDTRGKVDELKFIRDQMVASLGVPPAFIGIEENLSNKAALSEENILFARTVISHQRYLTHQINDLIQKLFDIIDPETALSILDFVEVALPVPRSLQFEREARYMSDVANLVEALERIGIPREYSKKKYLSQIDWDEVKKFEISQKIDKALDPAKQDESGLFGGSYGGMGGGGAAGGGMPPGGEGGFGGGV
jgi:hypothetical protein